MGVATAADIPGCSRGNVWEMTGDVTLMGSEVSELSVAPNETLDMSSCPTCITQNSFVMEWHGQTG